MTEIKSCILNQLCNLCQSNLSFDVDLDKKNNPNGDIKISCSSDLCKSDRFTIKEKEFEQYTIQPVASESIEIIKYLESVGFEGEEVGPDLWYFSHPDIFPISVHVHPVLHSQSGMAFGHNENGYYDISAVSLQQIKNLYELYKAADHENMEASDINEVISAVRILKKHGKGCIIKI